MIQFADPLFMSLPGGEKPLEKPDTSAGRQTPLQSKVAAAAPSSGFTAPPAGTYETYRKMIGHPTIALARSVVHGSIIAGSWTFEAHDDAKDEWVEFIQAVFGCLRPFLLPQMLRVLDYGWQPFERVWARHPVKIGKTMRDSIVVGEYVPLLPDITTILVTDKGEYTGLKQKNLELPPLYSFCASWDVEAGNLYGRARNENVRDAWWKWVQTDDRGGSLTTKVSNIIPQIHYPMGESRDATGRVQTNFEAAQSILNNLALGRGVALPNMYANSNDSKVDAEMAGKSAWVISFLEAAGAAQALAGVTDRQKYYDVMMLRGWLVPERAAIEGQFGTKAEAAAHADIALLGCAQIDDELARMVNRHVDDVLELNFGPEARGQVYIEPAPLSDEALVVFREIFAAVLANPGTLEELVTQIDMDSLVDALGIPKPEGRVVDFTGAVANPDVPKPEPSPAPVGD